MAPRIRVAEKSKCPDPFGRAFAARIDGPLLCPTFEYAPPTDMKKVAAKNADYYCARGFSHRSREDYRSALAEYQQALRLDPKHFNTFINQGVAWEKLNRADKAVISFTKAIEFADTKMDAAYARFNRGCCHGMLGSWESALEDFEKALKVDQTNENFHFNRGFALRQLGQFGIAVEDYQLTRAFRNEDFKAYFLRTGVHVKGTTQFKRTLAEEALKHVESDEAADKTSLMRRMLAMNQTDKASKKEEPVLLDEEESMLDEEVKTLLDIHPDDRTDEELMTLQDVLRSRGVFDALDVSEVTMLEMLRVMKLLTADTRSFLYHESQINPDLFVLLSGKVTLLCTPPQRSSQDETITKGTVFGNMNIESLALPPSDKTALVESRAELLVVNTRTLHRSIQKHHAGWIGEKQQFLSTSMLFRHWSKKKLYELALQFVEKVFRAGERVVTQEDPIKGLWIIKSGQCRASRRLQYTQEAGADRDLPDGAVQTSDIELKEMWRREYIGEDVLLSHLEGSAEESTHELNVTAVTPAVLLFINAADAQKLICPDQMTIKLLKEAVVELPPDSQLLDSLFANNSWGRFKESLQMQLQSSAIENIDIDDSFPSIPANPPKVSNAERPYQTSLHKWMKEHRDFTSINRC